MRKTIFAIVGLCAGIQLAQAWTYEIKYQSILKLAVNRNGDMLMQMSPTLPLSDKDLGGRCPGGWMKLQNASTYDLAKTLKQSFATPSRVIFSSVDIGIPIEGNPAIRTYCTVDWLESN